MKKTIILLVLGLTTAIHAKDLLLIDSIDVIVFGAGNTYILTKSDLTRPALDGSVLTKEQKIFNKLAADEAREKLKINITDEDVDRNLNAVMRDNDINQEQLRAMFINAGYTPEEGREEFREMTTVNQLLNFKIGQQLVIPEKEIREYYKKYPAYEPKKFLISRSLVPFSPKLTTEQMERKLKQLAAMKKDIFKWSSPFWIAEEDIAEDKKFIINMAEGDISVPQKIEDGFELFKVIEIQEKRLRTFDERHNEIVNRLRPDKSKKLMDDYTKELLDKAAVVYLN